MWKNTCKVDQYKHQNKDFATFPKLADGVRPILLELQRRTS